MTYYVIECKRQPGCVGYDELGNNTEIVIQTRPGRTNMSHEERASGWLGTTNNYYAYAHGEFATLAEAEAFIAANWPYHEYNFDEERDNPDDHWYRDTRHYYSADDWFYEYPPEVTADMTDEQLEKLAEVLEEEIDDNEVKIVGIRDYLERRREEAIVEALEEAITEAE